MISNKSNSDDCKRKFRFPRKKRLAHTIIQRIKNSENLIQEKFTSWKNHILQYRTTIIAFAITLLFIGIVFSIRKLNIQWENLNLKPALFNIFLLTPISIMLTGISLQLNAISVRRKIGFLDAFVGSAVGRTAEILPLPGGMMIRGAMLINAGASISESSKTIAITTLLTIFMAFIASSIPITASDIPSLGYPMLALGIVGTTACLASISAHAGIKIALAMTAIRVCTIALSTARFMASFATIGPPLKTLDATVFVICATLASSISLVPAGLGITESLAAALAGAINIAPPRAFLAAAINRFSGLTISGVVTFFYFLSKSRWRKRK